MPLGACLHLHSQLATSAAMCAPAGVPNFFDGMLDEVEHDDKGSSFLPASAAAHSGGVGMTSVGSASSARSAGLAASAEALAEGEPSLPGPNACFILGCENAKQGGKAKYCSRRRKAPRQPGRNCSRIVKL